MSSSHVAGALLVTGFGPFEGVPLNPSGRVARALHAPPRVHGLELPVSYARSLAALDALLAYGLPACICALGVHDGESFRLEARAVGARAERVDVDGVRARARMPDAPALETDLDLHALARALRAAGAPSVEISHDAGGYLCEHVFAWLLARAGPAGAPVAFLHVPPARILDPAAQRPIVQALLDALPHPPA